MDKYNTLGGTPKELIAAKILSDHPVTITFTDSSGVTHYGKLVDAKMVSFGNEYDPVHLVIEAK